MKKLFAFAISLAATFSAMAQASKPGTYYVKEPMLEERLGPSKSAPVANKLYLQQKVDVLEVKGDWARVTKYYDANPEGKGSLVARWVLSNGLSQTQPKEPPQPKLVWDSRVGKGAIPKVGMDGLSSIDVEILHKATVKFLNSGKCSKIELADKSVSKPNTYYINCGGPNIFFTPSDVQ